MLPDATPPPRGGRPASPLAALVLALTAATAAGCAGAPAPSVAAPPPADRPFAFRDPSVGAPPPPLDTRDARSLATAVDAVRRGDAALAERTLEARRKKRAGEPEAFRLARAYVDLAGGRLEEARPVVAALEAAHPAWVAAVETGADLAAAEGRAVDALERYRALLALVPGDRRARSRTERLRVEVAAAKRLEAEAALASGDLDGARRAANSLLQLEPASPSAFLLLSRAASAGGNGEDAWTWAKEARKKAPADRDVAAFAAEAAARTGRWAEAAALYEGLAPSDPGFARKAAEARAEFRVQNLPAEARHAVESPRLTRAQLATLLWWTLPEFRDALVPPGAGIAVDVVDRADRVRLAKAIGLGFFAVSPETHRVGADSAVSRTEMAGALRRVALLAGRGRTPRGCLAPEVPSASALGECGILSDTPSRNVTGREALGALERAARLGREGGSR